MITQAQDALPNQSKLRTVSMVSALSDKSLVSITFININSPSLVTDDSANVLKGIFVVSAPTVRLVVWGIDIPTVKLFCR